ncbi:ribosomal large subunit pseudouridine synthase F [Vibrio crassostreae]|uniref:23S rRNA pseudouridine(2604) synthase RluF n=1 Tax=Vibrio crassostreae TaxID=246167 RepID=UPI000631C061|nr:23S rRNA pseudouridine(2604) synthase RluF [Vibrio crassostreae]ROO76457.1 ribosomal large subunit pseudouridine synthase F [Vibrio crassostreae]ROP14467.1 ribosomal large subunit pseudouridine synthase F [Vibrio crassostreae]ROS58941.1 ribosomal large subunit pseudouridine synthase F [Vibrio crassostreae]RPE94297.1 ribosomal large subunit pseudouridine synthase F [Vibrio crassostreae]RPF17037.1 ribosomal large subunit pseudouridine synthase F [Vibrio crassostreae]
MSQESQAKRLNKYISETGFCSRREADKLIDAGRVTINGKIPEMGTKVLPGDDVEIDNKPVRSKEKPIYIALNKPTGITCTTERDIPGNIVDFIGHHKRIFPIGRLDKPSDGLIFLTNDGDIVNKILRAGNNHEKEYVVRVDKPITTEFLKQMGAGVHILDTVTLPCKVEKETKFSFRITLTQGLNRQIRRMCEALGYEVFKLRRVRIMNISLDGIPNGKWRYLSDEEITEILAMCEGSVSTEDASKMNAKGQRIRKATDAKLFDSREENQTSTARRNQKEHRTRTYRGNNADEFRHAPNSKRGRNSSNGESGGNTENWKSNSRSERSNSDRNRSDRNRTDRDNNDRRSGKPANRSQDSNRPNKPAQKRVSGTLGLKK